MEKFNREQRRDRERTALEMRQRGSTQLEIGRALGCEQGTVSRMLARIDARALKDMGDACLAYKMAQTSQLEWLVAENLRAWEESKKRRTRVVNKMAPGHDDKGKPTGKHDSLGQVVELVEQTGDVRYLHAAMSAMDRLRSLWGLDVAAADQEYAGTVADLTRDLEAKRREYETRRAAQGAAGDAGRTGEAAPLRA